MKKLLLLSIATSLFVSCATPIFKTPYVKEAYVFDYSEYKNKGFFITEANSVSFPYEPIGSVYSVNTTGYEVLSADKVEIKKTSDDVMNSSKTSVRTVVKYGDKEILATRKDVLEEMYKKALASGANGIINLNFSISGQSISATGMAIKK